ncbi:VWFA domain-containing protein [Favolaschia claudopus]|uniref:VWFA domain-containing protein n=1 Tax=Favolaschia claudopus TaxID=2862362 RepID=A0AAW0BGA6_9AGAR
MSEHVFQVNLAPGDAEQPLTNVHHSEIDSSGTPLSNEGPACRPGDSSVETTAPDVDKQETGDEDSVASSDEFFSTGDYSEGTERQPAETTADVDPEAPAPSMSLDLVNSVHGMFRVLDLISEDSSVNKIIISQDSLKAFINELCPGAYFSLTKVDFKMLDQLLIKPAGLYGSKTEIVTFLSALGAVDELTANALCTSTDDAVGPSLRSGLYLLRTFSAQSGKEQIFVIYWPEDTTWDDNALSSVARNRETFMRYLTKMCDQVTCLISREHAQSIVWNDESEDAATNENNKKPSRLYKFTVEKTNEQEETVATRPGFEIELPAFVTANRHDGHDHPIDPVDLQPRLICGETKQAILTTVYTPAGLREIKFEEECNPVKLRDLLKGDIEFSADLRDAAIEALLSSPAGPQVQKRYGKALDQWRARNTAKHKELNDCHKKESAGVEARLRQEVEQNTDQTRQVLGEALKNRFPSVEPDSFSDIPEAERHDLHERFWELVHQYPAVETEFNELINGWKVDAIQPEASFRPLKETLLYIHVFLNARQDTPQPQREASVIEILSKRGFPLSSTDSTTEPKKKTGLMSSVFTHASALFRLGPWADREEEEVLASEAAALARNTSDAQFLANLDDLLDMEPVLHDIVNQVDNVVTDHLRHCIEKYSKILLGRIVQIQSHVMRGKLDKVFDKKVAETSRGSLQKLRADMQAITSAPPVFIAAFEAFTPRGGSSTQRSAPNQWFQAASFNIKGFRRLESQASLDYQIHSLFLPTDQQEHFQRDSSFIPSPRVANDTSGFSLSPDFRVVHAQLIENGDLLLVIENSSSMFIYLEKPGRFAADFYRRHRKTAKREKIGENAVIAYNESTRTLLICSTSKLQFHLYVFDETFGSLHGAGSIDLDQSFSKGAVITHACFLTGSEEIAIIDSENIARIYSLLPRQFRPATITLPHTPVSAHSSPDGACLLVSYPLESGLQFHAYHWDTFGSVGIDLGCLEIPHSALSLTSILDRRNVHLLGISDGLCSSIALTITKKATEFMFTETAGKTSAKAKHNSGTVTHNILLNCHSDVWARFPVIPAVQRQTIISSNHRLARSMTFSTCLNQSKFSPYFDALISTFEQQTRKPTGNLLKRITVDAVDINVLQSYFSSNSDWAVSEFRAGEWIVDLLCLIPIQIAVTHENRFMPLSNGVVSLEWEQQLLGAELSQIISSLSLGWYESVFSSLVGVICLILQAGEQSVGKSFSLNHLRYEDHRCVLRLRRLGSSSHADAEGVWMSVTPTDDTLIVALDFEGVHSIERSSQEDMLLVLFNTAISNLVLFRNNFAISRSISGLFSSFQSSSKMLNPEANPQLFKSTLVIIIKDVVDSDEEEIVREFSMKFKKIVADEQGANFISRLHHGQLDIIPWPVIESKEFYALFPTLKKTLDQQEITHQSAGEFLHTIKTLMAKLKANDWGALSETLATHRAQRLCTYLNKALEFGFFETEPVVEPLKNFDTDIPIDEADTSSRFLLSTSEATAEQRHNILAALQQSWNRFDTRHDMSEEEWIAQLSQFLLDRAETRIQYVFRWIGSNLLRFTSNNAAMDLLRRDFDSGAVDLRSNVEICRMQCASCNLQCLLGRRHGVDVPHNCQTSHKCPHLCDFDNDHTRPVQCGYSAGHSGKHICIVGVHLCGEPCTLEDKNGCMKKCTKVAKHSGAEHMCDARVHACGAPCSLRGLKMDSGETYTCPQTCVVPSHELHERHACNVVSCPMTCQLCKRLCANSDHLHGLDSNARHLCGQEHKCAAFCQSKGICQIETVPHSIETMFTGRYENYSYTKANSKHLHCAIKIAPNEIDHKGPHVHTEGPDPFHYCETRCMNCGYLCTRRIGHPEQEHHTTHGSMSKTSWSVDGPDDTVLELKGRKFASRDEGAPMLCNQFCQDMGRHVHIDYCRRATDDAPCDGAELEHIVGRMAPNPDQPKDWISHSLFWKRTDPYSQDDQANFAKCEFMCPGPEHTTANPPAPSYCTLPILHRPQIAGQVVPADHVGTQSYISRDGHMFACQNPAEMRPAYHVSGSMSYGDYPPLRHRPGTELIIQHGHNNRLGAVFSSLHAFWISRSSALQAGGRDASSRKDAYSVIFFDSSATVCLQNDTNSTPDQLLWSLLGYSARGGTTSTVAISTAEAVMRDGWRDSLDPVVIFLSDGECRDARAEIESLSNAAVTLGKPLSFHSVIFGPDAYGRQSLGNMAQYALDIQNATPNHTTVPSSFSEALNEVRLAEAFLGFAESLRKPRGSLLRG